MTASNGIHAGGTVTGITKSGMNRYHADLFEFFRNGTLNARRVNKYARRILLTIGLLCSKSFEYEGMRRVLTEDYGIPLEDVAKVNIKGRFQVWRRSTGELVEIPLKRMQEATRAGCKLCPDFAAEHADISVGGLGQRDGWTLTVPAVPNLRTVGLMLIVAVADAALYGPVAAT